MKPVKNLLLVVFFLQMSVLSSFAVNHKAKTSYTVYVTVNISGLTSARGEEVRKAVESTRDVNVEYMCTVADIVVLRQLHSPFNSEGDVISYFKGLLKKAGVKEGIKFLSITIVKDFESDRC